MKLSLRAVLVLLGAAVLGSSALILNKGLRYPPPQFIPDIAPTGSFSTDGGAVQVDSIGAIFQQRNGDRLEFRAFTPEPEFTLQVPGESQWQIEVQNIHPEAELISSDPSLVENVNGLTRIISGSGGETQFRWRFPESETYRFAAIGDTGGGVELRWVLKRAHMLGADFVLLLGDFVYGPGEYLGAVDAFDTAMVPTYVAIGNHDFYEGLNSIHHLFRRHIGPRNAVFDLGGVRFINVDTAAGFFPADAGVRGEFLRALKPADELKDIVLFTHKPLADPLTERDHRISGLEYDFLHGEFSRLGVKTLLAGHIHIKEDFQDGAIRTIITGQGLAHADLIVDRPIAEILLGDVSPGSSKVDYHWAPLDMPFAAHCSPRAWEVLVAIEKPGVLRQLKEICSGD
jgi:hypothetical protein